MRILSPNEREVLRRRGCRFMPGAEVFLTDGAEFRPDRITNVTFEGVVSLGCDVTLDNVGLLSMSRNPDCAYGDAVNVLDETGSLSVPLYPDLTAVHARAFVSLRDSLPSGLWTSDVCRKIGGGSYGLTIGGGAVVRNCGELRDVAVGEGAVVEGVCSLRNGVVGAESRIGEGVIASWFMTGKGAEITGGCIVEHSFVGEGCVLSGGFTSRHSLIFDNSRLDGGESEALLAGAHTVSMHKSTLLIGVMTSFFNAGSGTNFSNHRYKTGPRHFGVLARGVKMGSDSYIMWPARVGAYSVVMGRHYKPFDSVSLPYSYITAADSGSAIIPGAALKSVGFMRDIAKWPQRDRRIDKSGALSYDEFPASVVSAAMTGLELLKSGRNFRALQLSDHHRRSGIEVYTTLIDHAMSGAMMDCAADFKPDFRPVDFGGLECAVEDVEQALATASEVPAEKFMVEFAMALEKKAAVGGGLAALSPRWERGAGNLSRDELAAIHDATGEKLSSWWRHDAESEEPFLHQSLGFISL